MRIEPHTVHFYGFHLLILIQASCGEIESQKFRIEPIDTTYSTETTDFDDSDTDLCPQDDQKTAPGICGCGVQDDDGDNDGTPDCNEAESQWVSKKNMPYAAGDHAAAVLGNKLHIMGGCLDWDCSVLYQKHWVYDTTTDSWSNWPTNVPDNATDGAQAHVYQGLLYLVGGAKDGTLLRTFTPNLNSWEYLPNIPTQFGYGFVSAVVGNYLYVIGGNPGADHDADVYKFHLIEEFWSPCSSIPENQGTGALAGAAVKNKIYVLNGDDAGNNTILQIYDTVGDSWSQGQDLGGHFEVASSVALGDKVYFFGGAEDQDAVPPVRVSRWINIYDTVSDTWSNGIPMPTARMFSTASIIDGQIHVLGGFDAYNNGLQTHEVFQP